LHLKTINKPTESKTMTTTTTHIKCGDCGNELKPDEGHYWQPVNEDEGEKGFNLCDPCNADWNCDYTHPSLQFYPFEINGQKYLICKLPNQPFSTLHDPATKKMVGQWNNDVAQYEIFPHEDDATTARATARATATDTATATTMNDQQFEEHMRQLIASGAAFTIVD